eukprot:548756_1
MSNSQEYKIEELKLTKSIHSSIPKLKSINSAIFKLYPSHHTYKSNTIHQIWIQGEQHLKQNRPHFYKNYLEYKQINNGNTCLWSEEMIESLIVHEYSHLLTLYHSYSHFIMRVDIAKYIILHYYGGFYVDMDSECRLNFDGLSKISTNNQPIVCKVTDDYRTKLYAKKFINNHFLYIPYRKHPFMDVMLSEASITAKRKPLEPMILYILRAVGPGFLMHCLKKYKKEYNKGIKSKLKGKNRLFYKNLKTHEIVNVIDSHVLDTYFFHESKNTWLEDQWMDSKDKNDFMVVFGAIAISLGSASLFVAPFIPLLIQE